MNDVKGCESCDFPLAAIRPHSGLSLCDICNPWVEASLRRTAVIPSWGANFQGQGDDFNDVHTAMLSLSKINEDDWDVISSRTNTPHPASERAWLEFIEWALDDSAPDVVTKVRRAVETREFAMIENSNLLSLSRIRNQLKLSIYEDEVNIAGHLIKADQKNQLWIGDGYDTVQFGSNAYDLHCQRTDMLHQLLFDRFHNLEQRPLEELAYIYWREPWMSLIENVTYVNQPMTPAIREAFTRMASGSLGEFVSDRCKLAILLWASQVEKEFMTCNRSAWAKSFQWVREIIVELSDSARIGKDGIYVDGKSGNLYRIAPEKPWWSERVLRTLASGDYFEVRKVARIGNEMSDPICIHVAKSPENEAPFDVILGDIVASLILCLRDDLRAAESIGSLFRQLPMKYQRRERPGDRTAWRRY